jgi:predicted MPP superfamily phosphohydrolase
MWKEFERRNASGNPVRFVLTTGDNIYGDISNFLFGMKNTGASDTDWAKKFFEPYKELLLHVPFYATLGNHDGNETESRGDLAAFLDNFFFPDGNAGRWYQFNYAGLADFFALDTTMNTESGPPSAQYLENRPEFAWMQRVIPASQAPWKIPYFHHPPFNAGPRHSASYHDLQHWIELFARSGVKVSFQGHEHNFQVSQTTGDARGIHFVVSGAGGQLRTGDIRRKMPSANIAAFAPQNHFLVVEIEDKTMRITPLGFEPVQVRDANGHDVPIPITVTLP